MNEEMIARVKIAARLGDIERIYQVFDMDVPPKLRVAMFFIHQFETSEFGFTDMVYKEEQLQLKYE